MKPSPWCNVLHVLSIFRVSDYSVAVPPPVLDVHGRRRPIGGLIIFTPERRVERKTPPSKHMHVAVCMAHSPFDHEAERLENAATFAGPKKEISWFGVEYWA